MTQPLMQAVEFSPGPLTSFFQSLEVPNCDAARVKVGGQVFPGQRQGNRETSPGSHFVGRHRGSSLAVSEIVQIELSLAFSLEGLVV